MRAIRNLCAAIVFAAAGFLPQASATSFTTDQSDIWSVTGEDGWGFQMIQRGSVIFVTVYVYDETRTPIWYTATLDYIGDFVWSGDLILTSGPWFGTVPFNANTVTVRKVGTMRWTAKTTTTGELRYDVDGVPVVKNARRFLAGYDDFSGRYGGGLHVDTTGCFNAGFNGTIEGLGTLVVTQNNQAMTLVANLGTAGSCTFTGILSQAGQFGDVSGTYSCSGSPAALFEIYEMQVNISGLTFRFETNSNASTGCKDSGWFGGMRATTF
jgi:hypothetical protein